jgi:tRNA threonylcarbamoyladenosine biosynthesis protein TsaE
MSTGMIWQTSSTSSAETETLGELLGKHLKGGEVIELRSDLGGGKTTFVRGLTRGVGYKGAITSPTFTLSRIYPAKKFNIHHLDFYRLKDPGVLANQLSESIEDEPAVVVIEWADIVKDVLPDDALSIEFVPVASNADERQITFHYPEKYRDAIAAVEFDKQETQP